MAKKVAIVAVGAVIWLLWASSLPLIIQAFQANQKRFAIAGYVCIALACLLCITRLVLYRTWRMPGNDADHLARIGQGIAMGLWLIGFMVFLGFITN